MAHRYTFGDPPDDDDVLVIQGEEYSMQPIGLRAMRRMLDINRRINANANAAGTNGDNDPTEERLDAALELILSSVKAHERDRLREHIEDRVPPKLLVAISRAVADSFSDLDPTLPASSSNGSVPDGEPSTEPALPAASTSTP